MVTRGDTVDAWSNVSWDWKCIKIKNTQQKYFVQADLAQSSAFPQGSEAFSVIEGNTPVTSWCFLYLLGPGNLDVFEKDKSLVSQLCSFVKTKDNFDCTWYFSPSALLVTGIRTPSMSAYRAGVWLKISVTQTHKFSHNQQKEISSPLHHRRQAWIQRWKESQRGPETSEDIKRGVKTWQETPYLRIRRSVGRGSNL